MDCGSVELWDFGGLGFWTVGLWVCVAVVLWDCETLELWNCGLWYCRVVDYRTVGLGAVGL